MYSQLFLISQPSSTGVTSIRPNEDSRLHRWKTKDVWIQRKASSGWDIVGLSSWCSVDAIQVCELSLKNTELGKKKLFVSNWFNVL